MKITVFTSNQPRHTALLDRLAPLATELFAVQECNTVFPGQVPDFFKKSDVMQRYFSNVLRAESEVFGPPRFPRATNIRQLPIKMGDANLLPMESFAPALDSDLFVIFGATFLKGPLCEHLVSRRAINIHMGVSPFYRGSSTNFWAMYDRRPQYVGATVHLLTTGLDSGPILFHAFPKPAPVDPFTYGMLSVRAAHEALAHHISAGTVGALDPIPQDRTKELRYTKNVDFTDAVAAEYLDRLPTPTLLESTLRSADRSECVRPVLI